MTKLTYLIGDATIPTATPALICHVCNDVGAFGAGFVAALSKRTRIPEMAYKTWYAEKNNSRNPMKLGAIQIVSYLNIGYVCNMIAQKGIRPENGVPPIRYDALEQALGDASEFAKKNDLVIAMPRIGAKLAGGDWAKIEQIIKNAVSVECHVYTLPSEQNDWPNTQYVKQAGSDSDIDLNSVFS